MFDLEVTSGNVKKHSKPAVVLYMYVVVFVHKRYIHNMCRTSRPHLLGRVVNILQISPNHTKSPFFTPLHFTPAAAPINNPFNGPILSTNPSPKLLPQTTGPDPAE
jgi:hypothetical protein